MKKKKKKTPCFAVPTSPNAIERIIAMKPTLDVEKLSRSGEIIGIKERKKERKGGNPPGLSWLVKTTRRWRRLTDGSTRTTTLPGASRRCGSVVTE
jgi:hypothetical protein